MLLNPDEITKIPVFILHWNRPHECLKTVESFLQQGEEIIEITIIDNNSSLDNFQYLQSNLPPNINLVSLPENKGWGGAFNILLKRWLENSSSEYCFISAHDTLLHQGCLQLLLQGMDANPNVGIACPEYGYPTLPKYSPIRGPFMIPTDPRERGFVEPVDFAHATLSLFRKSCIQMIGLFDERYFAYGDEYDISLRARSYGWDTAIVWGAVITNPGSWTSKPIQSYLLARNTLLLALIHGGTYKALIRTVLMLINTLRMSIFLMISKEVALAKFKGIYDFLSQHYGQP
ncbi:glycosyltransferase family 2 protein [Trichothermofontia sichuanensis B231]|uniref:glycosyltransferase n=1 Tax=Trichothermofontia sichuanensis TaxID=3045816 RepID=UPI0022482C5A|nr:glycosyltransferase family 2 protein [Trichothermofontia sichuanensis]UZQ55321.1 glycosyltransferase family 2 protein [Trichothermofontia sichuanensis B231]